MIVRAKEGWNTIINNRESHKPVYFVPRQMDVVLGLSDQPPMQIGLTPTTLNLLPPAPLPASPRSPPRPAPCLALFHFSGGTVQEGNESLLVSEADTKDILARIEEMVGPSAARDKLDILAERVGLRPCRPEVRLEKELFHGGTKLVVHNYGHGTIKVSKAHDGLGRADSDVRTIGQDHQVAAAGRCAGAVQRRSSPWSRAIMFPRSGPTCKRASNRAGWSSQG